MSYLNDLYTSISETVSTNYNYISNMASEYTGKLDVYKITDKALYVGNEFISFGNHLVNKFPEALKEAVFLDGLLVSIMTIFSFSGKIAALESLGFFSVYIAPYILPIAVVWSLAEISITTFGATIAYDIRKAANEYFGKDAVVENVGIGVVAGAIKYGISGLTLGKTTLFIGAVNNGLYEYFKPEVGDTVGNLDVIGLQASLFQIEGTDAILKKMLTENVNLKSELLTTLKVTVLLSGSLWGFLQDKKLSEINFATLERVPNHYNKVCNDLIGQKCHDYVLMLISEIKVVGIQKSESTQICYSNQINFKDLDVCYINELAMPINKNLEIEHDEL